jgi:endonuclease/exonuclease/phosphatase family metal-dependent hydrolase
MIKRLTLLVALAIVLAGRAATAEKPTLRVMSYNIHHGEGTDGRFDLPRLARVIGEARADLVALQEVDVKTLRSGGVDQAAELSRLTGMHVAFGAAMPHQVGQYGDAVLSRYPLLEIQRHALPAPAGFEPRVAVAVRIRPEAVDRDIWFASTHLDHLKTEVRIPQAERIVDAMQAVQSPVILAGDLNARPDSPTMAILLKVWTDAGAKNPQPTAPSHDPRARIDYVLYRPADAWRVVETRVLAEQVASDHRPLLTILQWEQE